MKIVNFEDGHCKRIRSHLDSYLNNELTVEEENMVLTHLEVCDGCTQSFEESSRLKAQLKHAVMRESAPGSLRERIASDRRRRHRVSFRATTIPFAVAAGLVIALTTFLQLNFGAKHVSNKPELETTDANARVLRIGLDDHVFCAIDHKLADQRFSSEQISMKLGPEYVGLVELVNEKMPGDFAMVVGHRCHYRDREFVHLILRSQNDVISLVITRKNNEVFQPAGAAAIAQAADGPLYHTALANYRVAGLETRDHLVFVVSNGTDQANLWLASRLAPSVREFLARLES
jgi:hypothetical protein